MLNTIFLFCFSESSCNSRRHVSHCARGDVIEKSDLIYFIEVPTSQYDGFEKSILVSIMFSHSGIATLLGNYILYFVSRTNTVAFLVWTISVYFQSINCAWQEPDFPVLGYTVWDCRWFTLTKKLIDIKWFVWIKQYNFILYSSPHSFTCGWHTVHIANNMMQLYCACKLLFRYRCYSFNKMICNCCCVHISVDVFC